MRAWAVRPRPHRTRYPMHRTTPCCYRHDFPPLNFLAARLSRRCPNRKKPIRQTVAWGFTTGAQALKDCRAEPEHAAQIRGLPCIFPAITLGAFYDGRFKSGDIRLLNSTILVRVKKKLLAARHLSTTARTEREPLEFTVGSARLSPASKHAIYPAWKSAIPRPSKWGGQREA